MPVLHDILHSIGHRRNIEKAFRAPPEPEAGPKKPLLPEDQVIQPDQVRWLSVLDLTDDDTYMAGYTFTRHLSC